MVIFSPFRGSLPHYESPQPLHVRERVCGGVGVLRGRAQLAHRNRVNVFIDFSISYGFYFLLIATCSYAKPVVDKAFH